MSLTIRRARTFIQVDHEAAEDDFDIMDGNTRVGRLYYQATSDDPWRWCLSGVMSSSVSHGRAKSRVEALANLSEEYYAGSHLRHDPQQLGRIGAALALRR
jgi:hypothetical protein